MGDAKVPRDLAFAFPATILLPFVATFAQEGAVQVY